MNSITPRQKSLHLYLGQATSSLGNPLLAAGQSFDDDFWAGQESHAVKSSLGKIIDGIRKYQNHSYDRAASGKTVWQDGSASLKFFGGTGLQKRILIIPSLINGSEILDILPDRSFVKWLAAQGYGVYLLDWGNLTRDPDLQTLEGVIGVKLAKALQWLGQEPKTSLIGLGYCMGGLLLAAADRLYPDAFDALAFVATPWDFKSQVTGNFPEKIIDWAKSGLAKTMHVETMTAQAMQAIFMTIDPNLTSRKFSAFAEMAQESHEAKLFVAVEDWLNGGSDLPNRIVQHIVQSWYLQNQTMNGDWTIAGRKIDARQIDNASIIIVPGRDKIVPPASAAALATQIADAELLQIDCGHISMMVSGRAEKDVWLPLHQWMASIPM